MDLVKLSFGTDLGWDLVNVLSILQSDVMKIFEIEGRYEIYKLGRFKIQL